MEDKRGQGLSTNAIILIILGIVVLAILILGFTMGWKNLAPWFSPNNVDTIVKQCDAACATNMAYAYCRQKRELKAEETLVDVTCYYLSEKQTQYGVRKCASISCDLFLVDANNNEDVAILQCPRDSDGDIIEGAEIQYLEKNQLKTFVCTAP